MKIHDSLNRIIIVLVSLTILLSNCKNSSENKDNDQKKSRLVNNDLIIIDLDTTKQILGNYSDFFSSAHFIPLETSNESLIGVVGQLELFNDTIYILDHRSAKGIFVFTLSGKFIRKIGVNGKGPGEWILPSNFCIDKNQRLLYVLDSQLQRITIMQLEGQVIKQISLKNNSVRSHYIECKNGRIFLDARHFGDNENLEDYMVFEIDSTGTEINKWFSIDKDNKGWNHSYYLNGSGTFYSSPSSIRFVELFMDTIYSITDDGMLPFITIKSSEMFDRESVKEIQSTVNNGLINSRELYEKNGYWAINSYIENDDLIYFTFHGKHMMNNIIINKSTNQIRFLKGLFDDITYKEIVSGAAMPNFYSGENKLIVGAISDPKRFRESINNNITKLPVEEKERLINISELNNPILIVLKTKSVQD